MSDWNATLYDDNHNFVSNFGQDLVSLLEAKQGERILDLGCGTGDLAYKISQSGAHVTGIDASENMIKAAKEKYPDIQFKVQNGEEFTFEPQFNAIFSNAALHWMKNQEKVIQNCFNALQHDGRFVCELGGANNIQSIINAVKEATSRLSLSFDNSLMPWVFPTQEKMTDLLLDAGFEVIAIELYERPTPLDGEKAIQNWLEMFGDNMFRHLEFNEKEDLFNECEKILLPQLYQSNRWIADYWRLRFIAKKP